MPSPRVGQTEAGVPVFLGLSQPAALAQLSPPRLILQRLVLVGLYEEPERPPNAVDYIKR